MQSPDRHTTSWHWCRRPKQRKKEVSKRGRDGARCAGRKRGWGGVPKCQPRSLGQAHFMYFTHTMPS